MLSDDLNQQVCLDGKLLLRGTEVLFISVGSPYLLWLKGLILLSYMLQGKLDHTKHWSDLFICHILIFMHVTPLTFLTQYLKRTGRKNIFSSAISSMFPVQQSPKEGWL